MNLKLGPINYSRVGKKKEKLWKSSRENGLVVENVIHPFSASVCVLRKKVFSETVFLCAASEEEKNGN
jgi:hypothetical protein